MIGFNLWNVCQMFYNLNIALVYLLLLDNLKGKWNNKGGIVMIGIEVLGEHFNHKTIGKKAVIIKHRLFLLPPLHYL